MAMYAELQEFCTLTQLHQIYCHADKFLYNDPKNMH